MRDKEKKHRKGQETTIGKIIYGFLLFMPLIAIGVTCGYAMFNKNAYLSWRNKNVHYEEPTEIEVGKEYYFSSKVVQSTTSAVRVNLTDYELISTSSSVDLTSITSFQLSNNGTDVTFYNGNTNITTNYMGSVIINFKFTYLGIVDSNSTKEDFLRQFLTVNVSETSNLSNVFYYSVDKVTESPLFNWAENSVIYTTTNATCNALSITAPFIPLLMSYWLIISVIYFLYDIALMLVWLIHKKIHELQESL